MKSKQRLKFFVSIIIIALAALPVTAAWYTVKKCVETDTTTTDTTGCSKGNGCGLVRRIDGSCKESGNYWLPNCVEPWIAPAEIYYTPGQCLKNDDGDVVCGKFDFTSTRYVPKRATCKFR